MSQYSINLQYSKEDKAYIATVPELPELNAFGSTPEEALKELAISQELYLEVMKEDGEKIPEPEMYKSFSGQTRIRLPKTLHASLSNEAQKEGVSLNTYIVHLLSERNALRMVKTAFDSMENRVQNILLYNYPPSTSDVKTETRPNIVIISEKSPWGDNKYAVGQ
jgi:predicted RNase H-like HicB family nuclease